MSEKFAYFAAYEQQCQQANKPIVGHHVSCDPNQALLQLLWQVGGIAAVDRQLTLPPSMRLRKDLGSEMAGLWKIPWVRRQDFASSVLCRFSKSGFRPLNHIRHQCGLGIVTIGSLSGRPIVPFAVATSRYRVINSCSRMTINLPFSKLGIVMGDPIFVP